MCVHSVCGSRVQSVEPLEISSLGAGAVALHLLSGSAQLLHVKPCAMTRVQAPPAQLCPKWLLQLHNYNQL